MVKNPMSHHTKDRIHTPHPRRPHMSRCGKLLDTEPSRNAIPCKMCAILDAKTATDARNATVTPRTAAEMQGQIPLSHEAQRPATERPEQPKQDHESAQTSRQPEATAKNRGR